MTVRVDHGLLARTTVAIAARLGERASRCGTCGRPVILTSLGRIPDHHTARNRCPGSDQPPPGGAS